MQILRIPVSATCTDAMCQCFALSQTQTFLQQNRNRAFNHHFMSNCAPHAFVSQNFSLILIKNGKNVNVTQLLAILVSSDAVF